MAVSQNKYPLAGFRYEVDIIPDMQTNFSLSNAKNLVAGAVTQAKDTSFSEVSGISVNIDTEDIEDGAGNILHLPKGIKYSPLILKRGLTAANSELMTWVASTIISEKVEMNIITKSIIVKLLSDQGEPIMYWVFTGAYPTKWSVSGLKAMSNELVIEEMELKYKAFYPVIL